MPIYEYRCEDCGKRFEYLARTLSDHPTVCPACGAEHLTKALSTFQANTRDASGCAHAATCPHTHGPGCDCCH